MPSPAHPLRRRYGAELALGIGLLVLASAVLFLGRGRPGRAGAERVAEPSRSAAGTADTLAEPAAWVGTREAVGGEGATLAPGPDSFAIDVVDEAGRRLASVLVDLVLEEPRPDERGRVLCTRRGSSDPSGRALFRLAQLALPAEAASSAGAIWRVTTSPEFADSPSLELPDTVAAGSKFRLVLPSSVAAAYGTVRVKVVDGSGTPVSGALVRWRASPEGRSSSLLQDGATQGDGTARLSLVPYRALRANEQRGGPPVQYCVELVVPPEYPRIDLGRDFPPRDEVTLVLPEVGSVVVRVSGHEGEPVRGPVTVELYGWSREDTAVDDERLGSALVDDPSATDAVATFPLVGLDLALRVEARRTDTSTIPGRLELAGPRAAGERIEATVRLGPGLFALRMRVVDERGAPLAHVPVRGTVSWSNYPQVQQRQTDGDGRLTLQLLQGQPGDVPGRLTLATLREPRTATVDLPSLDPKGSHELGTIVLRPER